MLCSSESIWTHLSFQPTHATLNMNKGHPTETNHYLHDCFSPGLLHWIGARESNPITWASFSREAVILLLAPCAKAGKDKPFAVSVVPFDCVWEKQGKATQGRHCSWLGSTSFPLWAEGCECLYPNLDTAEGSQGQSPWLRPSHGQGADILTATSSGKEGENYSLFCRLGNIAVILILMCPWMTLMPFFLFCPSESPHWKKKLSSVHSQNRLKSHYGWEPDAKGARAVILFCQVLNKSMTCKGGRAEVSCYFLATRCVGLVLCSCHHYLASCTFRRTFEVFTDFPFTPSRPSV